MLANRAATADRQAPDVSRTRVRPASKLLRIRGVHTRKGDGRELRRIIIALAGSRDAFLAMPVEDRIAIMTAATLLLSIQKVQASLARGEAVDEDLLLRKSSEARRVLASLRKRQRASAPAGGEPNLADYLRTMPAEMPPDDDHHDEHQATAGAPDGVQA
jgi:hypothetical protein